MTTHHWEKGAYSEQQSEGGREWSPKKCRQIGNQIRVRKQISSHAELVLTHKSSEDRHHCCCRGYLRVLSEWLLSSWGETCKRVSLYDIIST